MSKFAFFGTPYVARDTLAVLLEHGYRPEVVITNPDAPRGRGHVLTPCQTKEFALAQGFTVLTPETLDAQTIAEITTYECDYAIVVAYGKIFPEELIRAFPKGAINIHYSLLPKYRGASPVETALLNNESRAGVTIQRMVRELDAGDILAQEATEILPEQTTRELRPRLVTLGANLLVTILSSFEAGTIEASIQDHTLATRAKKFKKEDGQLDLRVNAQENWNKYRAYAEWPGTYFMQDDKRIKIVKASFVQGKFVIERVVPEGKREMSYVDFAR